VLPVSVGLALVLFMGLVRRTEYHRDFAEFYLHGAARLRAHYAPLRPRLVERDDGIIAFSTGFPCMSGIGLVDDIEAVRARRDGRFFELAQARGFERVVTLVYGHSCSTDSECREALGDMARKTVGAPGARAVVEYGSGRYRPAVVRVEAASTP
jgi:hypothetical protein